MFLCKVVTMPKKMVLFTRGPNTPHFKSNKCYQMKVRKTCHTAGYCSFSKKP